MYNDGMLPVFQKETLSYFFITSSNYLIKSSQTIPELDKGFKPIGPTLLVEWGDE